MTNIIIASVDIVIQFVGVILDIVTVVIFVTTFVFTPPRTDRAGSHHRSRPLATDRPAVAAGVRPVHARSLTIAPLHAFAPPARSLDDVLRFTRTATSPSARFTRRRSEISSRPIVRSKSKSKSMTHETERMNE